MKFTPHKRKGQSTKPCHGCGSTLPHWSDQVCDQCATAIKGYNTIMAERAAAGDMVEMIAKERSYALPHMFKCPDDQRKEIQESILKLTNALSTPAVGVWTSGKAHIFDFKGQYGSSDFSTVVRIRPEHAQALGTLYEAMRQGFELAYQSGYGDGRNLLMGLASGKITSDEFNDKAARNTGATTTEY